MSTYLIDILEVKTKLWFGAEKVGFRGEASAGWIEARVGAASDKFDLTARRMRIIDERLAQPGPAPSLTELAGLCQLSVRQLMRSFRASRGRTLGDYIVSVRIEAAKSRLLTRESIKSVARSLHFGSAASFSCAFRRTTGMSPREYRFKMNS